MTRLLYFPILCLSLFLSISSSVPTEQHVLTPKPQTTPSNSVYSLIQRLWRGPGAPTTIPELPINKVPGRYSNDVVLRFNIKDVNEARSFQEALDTLFIDLWEASEGWADVRISKKVLPLFLGLLPDTMQQSHTPLITQLSQAVQDTYPEGEINGRSRASSGMPHDLFFENYQPLAVLYPWLRQLASMFPDRAQLFSIGESYEGRDIAALKIGIELPDGDPYKNEPRQTVVVLAGSHAREWISTSTAAYLLRSLLHNFDPHDHDLINKLLTHYDFIFVPVLNPDGYEHTWTTDRLWRKNRQETPLPFCRGIDLDRAFPFGWDGDNQTDNPCSETYAGGHPVQAVEAQRLVEWARNETQDGKRVFSAFIDLHSYSQEILYPYSYTCDRTPHNLEDLEELAIGLAKAFRLTNGHYYGIESACEGDFTLSTPVSARKNSTLLTTKLEESGGSALDFFYQDLYVKYAFQIKLRDTGTYGFLLPKENIVPTGVETFNALMGLGKWLLGNKGIENFSQSEIWGADDALSNDFIMTDEVYEDDEEDGPFWRRRR